MQREEKFGKVHFVLAALTLVFLAALAGLAVRDGAAGSVYRIGTAGAAEDGAYRVETERATPAEADGTSAYGPIDVNTAAAEELRELPGIGPALSQAIVDYRAEHGPFRSVDELLEVNGIGEAKLDGIRDAITVNGG